MGDGPTPAFTTDGTATEIVSDPLVERAVAALTELLDGARYLGSKKTAQQVALVAAVPRLRALVDAYACESVLQADRVDLGRSQGAASVAVLVGGQVGADPALLRADLRFGRWLADFAVLRDAFEAGAIFREHLDLIRQTVSNGRTFAALRRDQELFVGWVATLDFADFKNCCRYWMLANDPDGAEPAEQTANCTFRARRRGDGCVKLDGLLDPLSGAAFLTAFEREDQHLYRQAQDNPDPDVHAVEQHSRSTGRRGATALMNLITRGANRTESTAGDPLINIVMSEKVAEDLLARLNDDNRDDLPLAFGDIDARCRPGSSRRELGQPCERSEQRGLPSHFVLATLGIATFRRQIMNAAGRIIDISVNARCFNPWQKQALLVQARGRCRTRVVRLCSLRSQTLYEISPRRSRKAPPASETAKCSADPKTTSKATAQPDPRHGRRSCGSDEADARSAGTTEAAADTAGATELGTIVDVAVGAGDFTTLVATGDPGRTRRVGRGRLGHDQ